MVVARQDNIVYLIRPSRLFRAGNFWLTYLGALKGLLRASNFHHNRWEPPPLFRYINAMLNHPSAVFYLFKFYTFFGIQVQFKILLIVIFFPNGLDLSRIELDYEVVKIKNWVHMLPDFIKIAAYVTHAGALAVILFFWSYYLLLRVLLITFVQRAGY